MNDDLHVRLKMFKLPVRVQMAFHLRHSYQDPKMWRKPHTEFHEMAKYVVSKGDYVDAKRFAQLGALRDDAVRDFRVPMSEEVNTMM